MSPVTRSQPRTRAASAVAAAVTAGAVLLVTAAGARADYATVDQPGPALSVPQTALAAALTCSAAGVDHPSRAPVLLVHGTSVNARENWSHVYIPSLDARHIGWCTVQLPQRATIDIQVSAEYVVYAIRELHRRAGEPIDIIGASQGGMLPRWALRFWPDTRPMVDDMVGLVPSNHGTTQWPSSCRPCRPAEWQQGAGSNFIRALNSYQETFPGISYTNVYTHRDETVTPNADDTGSSSLHGGGGRITNVAIQDVCPIDPSEHILTGFADPIAYALAMDAIDHDGPADPARVARTSCIQLIGGLDLNHAPDDLLNAYNNPGAAARVPAEPPLACYVTASCG